MPESPRWLAVQEKYEELTKLLNKICKINGRKMPEDFNPESLLEEVIYRQLHSKVNDCYYLGLPIVSVLIILEQRVLYDLGRFLRNWGDILRLYVASKSFGTVYSF